MSTESTGFTFSRVGALTVITDDRFTAAGVAHGFTTRDGGVSDGEFASLNLAYSPDRTDPASNVRENYNILLRAFDTPESDAVMTNQLHTDTVEVADTLGGIGFTKPAFTHGVDGLVADTDGILLTVRMADCLPILLYDPRSGAVGAVHSGWKGTMQTIGAKAVEKMCHIYKCNKSDILVSFGPSVGKCCYQVGAEFRENFITTHGAELECAFERRADGLYADMRTINRLLLQRAGIPAENIAIYTPCTCCNPETFFSYRRQKTQRGTLAAVIKCKRTVK